MNQAQSHYENMADCRSGPIKKKSIAVATPSRSQVRSGTVQLSLFDEQDLAEIAAPDYSPGERLVVCRNPRQAGT